ncbi:MAG: MEDS domain-containing protein [Methanocella sp.]
MGNAARESGIDVIGDVPWGSHLCLFYQTGDDLSEVLVSFFQAGLRNNEFCMCVTSGPVNAKAMKQQMREAIPDFDDRVDKGQIEIVPHTEWYLADGVLDQRRVLQGWNDKLRQALDRGFEGVRLTGNTFWVDNPVWKDFLEYEQAIDSAIEGRNVIVLCTYPLDTCDASDILDVVSTHQFALARRGSEWKLIEHVELREAKRALQKSEENFRAAFEQAAVGMTRVSKEGRFLQVNQKFCDITGYTQEELAGLSARDITYQPDLAEESLLIQRLLACEIDTFSREKRYVRKDGTIVWINLTVTPIFHKGRLEYLMGITQDITQRKRAEEALKSERLQLLSIFDSIDEVIYVADPYTYEILYANKATQDRFGKLFVGGTCYRVLQGMDAPCEFCTNRVILENRGQPYRWEFHNQTVDRNFMIYDRIIRWPDGRDVRFELAIDITGRKRAEEELASAKARAELYLDLMGHDINNMHQIALGYLELARDMPTDGGGGEFLDKPIEVLQRSARLIKNVRKLQKLHDDVFQVEPVYIARVLGDVQREFGAVPDKSIMLNLNGREHCRVMANELLQDVFSNLVSNAIKHTGDHADIVVDLDVVEDHGRQYCRIFVEDDGPGIPDEFKGKIFNRLLKGTEKAKGMGLGLYLVKSLVGSFDGRVWVEDRVPGDHSKGAKFVVMLPVA